jgi:hypothetical protein
LFLSELQAVLVSDCEREDPADRVAGGGNEEGQGEDRKREMKTFIKIVLPILHGIFFLQYISGC